MVFQQFIHWVYSIVLSIAAEIYHYHLLTLFSAALAASTLYLYFRLLHDNPGKCCYLSCNYLEISSGPCKLFCA